MSAIKICKFIWLSILAVCIVINQPSLSVEKNEIDSHLDEYSHYNVAHHDNIDDEAHTHSHKHSEDGDEHEHNHEHSKVTQSEIKLLNHSLKVLSKVTVIEVNLGFSEKNLISNPHPNKIYRPPIYI
ncbi:MAG: hypothetical protein CME65_10525 [Halobacteriovoraceae bacterium]|nr:hypothetical protein [Halobacteriovoraceae bacterium]MBG59535.1 hypothetical protein [Peredibacter sp.]|tara:strand:- start:118649 stop:119029 length:381 start_codon:yes stop_codon:yes gene_type:complete